MWIFCSSSLTSSPAFPPAYCRRRPARSQRADQERAGGDPGGDGPGGAAAGGEPRRAAGAVGHDGAPLAPALHVGAGGVGAGGMGVGVGTMERLSPLLYTWAQVADCGGVEVGLL